jgi:cAMP and cAMP-inhibited cGMP 3',5'-cyclic phosphodiesterase 10
MLIESVMMTASDLCSSSKPWELQLATVTVIYEEFYRQGDIEIESGRIPVPIMDRTHDDEQALHQVAFEAVVFVALLIACLLGVLHELF